LQSGELLGGIAIGSIANIQSFINGSVQRYYLAFFNTDCQQKKIEINYQEGKRNGIIGIKVGK
jgi:hypothetical protein